MPEPTTRTVLVPTLIETVEQAEKLPVGVAARKDYDDGWVDLAVKGTAGWARIDSAPDQRFSDEGMIGWTALVPVEATVQWTAMGTDRGEAWAAYVGHDGLDGTRADAERFVSRHGGHLATNLYTPWTPEEEA